MRNAFIFFLLAIVSCNSTESDQVIDNQGVFEFPEIMRISGAPEIPEFLDPEKILCKGKGIRVARCISSQLKTGKCLGILKDGNQVYVVEIDCEEVKEPPKEDIELGDQ